MREFGGSLSFWFFGEREKGGKDGSGGWEGGGWMGGWIAGERRGGVYAVGRRVIDLYMFFFRHWRISMILSFLKGGGVCFLPLSV